MKVAHATGVALAAILAARAPLQAGHERRQIHEAVAHGG